MKGRILNASLLVLLLTGCSSGVIRKGEERNVITYLMMKDEVIELLGEPAKVIQLKGNDSYRQEGCIGDPLEVLQYESPEADLFTLYVINAEGFVCKRLEKRQKAVWSNS